MCRPFFRAPQLLLASFAPKKDRPFWPAALHIGPKGMIYIHFGGTHISMEELWSTGSFSSPLGFGEAYLEIDRINVFIL